MRDRPLLSLLGINSPASNPTLQPHPSGNSGGQSNSVLVDANAAFVDLWCRHHASAVTPCITYIGQHLGNLGVTQDLGVRGMP